MRYLWSNAMVLYITASAESENETEREMEAGSTAVVAGPHAGARTGLAMPLQRSLWVIICKLVISTVDMRHYNDKLQAVTTLTWK